MIAFLLRLLTRHRDRPDIGLTLEADRFGTKPANASAYSYELARQGFKRSQAHSASGQKLPVPRVHKKHTSNVVPLRQVGGTAGKRHQA